MGTVIVGSGTALPELEVSNDQLAEVMDTSDEWIRSRSGVHMRRYSDPGTGSATLGAQAVLAAIADAGISPDEVDLLISATMTPDLLAPGNAPLIQHQANLGPIAAFDIRQQCAGFLYGLELADAMLSSGRATTAVVVGAEAHAGYLPFGPSVWGRLRGEHANPVSDADYQQATKYRAWSVLFGDGAGAMVLRRDPDPTRGFLGGRLFSDGSLFDLIWVEGVGFRHQPYVDQTQLDAEMHLPSMNGMELFRQAVRLMPDSVASVADEHGLRVNDLDLVLAHQANERIIAAMRKQFGFDDGEDRVPCNIAHHGNTTAATLPLLYQDLRDESRIVPGQLLSFTAFGAGAHWGANLYRVP
jgi:3-oxoacyl-[acyl-carrier-protein] synthase-3